MLHISLTTTDKWFLNYVLLYAPSLPILRVFTRDMLKPLSPRVTNQQLHDLTSHNLWHSTRPPGFDSRKISSLSSSQILVFKRLFKIFKKRLDSWIKDFPEQNFTASPPPKKNNPEVFFLPSAPQTSPPGTNLLSHHNYCCLKLCGWT